MTGVYLERNAIRPAVESELATMRILDVHTHLFAPSFGPLTLQGIDELLTYHYLEAELFRSSSVLLDEYWELPKHRKADLIWQTLFVEREPISEATRGVITVLNALGLPTEAPNLQIARDYFAELDVETHRKSVFELAGLQEIVMTNDPLDPHERKVWDDGPGEHPQYLAALRLDRILNEWDSHWQAIAAQGFRVASDASPETCAELRRFLEVWVKRMNPVYMAVSLPDTFTYPEQSTRAAILKEAVLPVCREHEIPLALMIGVRRGVNPELRLAGDGVGRADLRSLECLCTEFPRNRFLVTLLSRENQHELCVCARKFRNLLPFGCWWFLNQPSLVREITTQRIEMLGFGFIPQHSDARVLEQLIYKWRTTRSVLAPILSEAFEVLADAGRPVSREPIRAAVQRLFRTNFTDWVGLTDSGFHGSAASYSVFLQEPELHRTTQASEIRQGEN